MIPISIIIIHKNLSAFCSGSPTPLIRTPVMTITFEHKHDIIVYTLKKIIFFPRDNHYTFVAQCVWWIASIIGLQHVLVTHIHNPKIRSNIEIREVSRTAWDLQEDLRIGYQQEGLTKLSSSINKPSEHYIDPDLISRIADDLDNKNSFEELAKAATRSIDSETDRQDKYLKATEEFIQYSKRERRAFNQKKELAPLHKTRSGNIVFKPLTKKQKNRLNAIPTDTLSTFINNMV